VTPAASFRLPPARRLVGVLALLLSAGYAVDAWQTLSMGRWHKPGAAIFPLAVGALLAISGVLVLLERHGGASDPTPATFSLPADGARGVCDLFPCHAGHRQHDRVGAVSPGDDKVQIPAGSWCRASSPDRY
jgi:hypothetical protein